MGGGVRRRAARDLGARTPTARTSTASRPASTRSSSSRGCRAATSSTTRTTGCSASGATGIRGWSAPASRSPSTGRAHSSPTRPPTSARPATGRSRCVRSRPARPGGLRHRAEPLPRALARRDERRVHSLLRSRGGYGKQGGIWIASSRGGAPVQRTKTGTCPQWSPDSRRLVYADSDRPPSDRPFWRRRHVAPARQQRPRLLGEVGARREVGRRGHVTRPPPRHRRGHTREPPDRPEEQPRVRLVARRQPTPRDRRPTRARPARRSGR